MNNMAVLIGRLVEQPTKEENYTTIKLRVPRIKEDKKDIIPLRMNATLGDNISRYCNIDDMIGVKGVLTEENGMIIFNVEKISFLATSKENNNEDNNTNRTENEEE